MPPFCPIVQKRKYRQQSLVVIQPPKQDECIKDDKNTTLWELKKQILFLQDMVIMKKV